MGRGRPCLAQPRRCRQPFRSQIRTDDGGTDRRRFVGQDTQPNHLRRARGTPHLRRDKTLQAQRLLLHHAPRRRRCYRMAGGAAQSEYLWSLRTESNAGAGQYRHQWSPPGRMDRDTGRRGILRPFPRCRRSRTTRALATAEMGQRLARDGQQRRARGEVRKPAKEQKQCGKRTFMGEFLP